MKELSRGLMLALLILGIGSLLMQPAVSWAADPEGVHRDRERGKVLVINCLAETPVTEQQVLESLSQDFSVPQATLRSEKEATNLDWSDFSFAYRISKKADVPLDRIVAEHNNGMGWCEIARDHNAQLGFTVIEFKNPHREFHKEGGDKEPGKRSTPATVTPGQGRKDRGSPGFGRGVGADGWPGR